MTQGVASDLEALLGPAKVLSDFAALEAYAIDASLYRITPQAVVLPETHDDIAQVLAYAGREHVPVTPRAGGTNLTGSAVGPGIILDISRMNNLLELNSEEQWVRVQPGMICAELNRRLAAAGLVFAPDPASAETCKIGGMLANNSAGPHTLKYGAVKDNTLALEVMLADGRQLTARDYALTEPRLLALLADHAWLRRVMDLVRSRRAALMTRRPAVTKNSSGYNLFALAEGLDHHLDLAKLFIGSEGTLGVITEATLHLVPRPARTVVALLYLNRLDDVGPAVQALLPLGPSAVEMMDANALNLIGRTMFDVPPEAAAMLLVEFDDEPLSDKLRGVETVGRNVELSCPMISAYDRAAQQALWGIRKAIYPALYKFDAKKKPLHFIDDLVVPADRASDLLRYLDGRFRDLGVRVAVYGHIGNGNLHVNPLLDVNHPDDLETMKTLGREVHAAVIKDFGGSLCGEHGDGRVRAEFLKDLYGPEVYGLFMEVKRLLDPDLILNPGVKLGAEPFTERIDTARFAKPCATCGKCNAVCPVYDVVQDESNSARGWFHILTSGDYTYQRASRVVEACLNCKSCREVCPAGVDPSRVVLDRRAEHPNRLAGWIFRLQTHTRLFESLVRFGGLTQPLWDRPAGRRLLDVASRPFLRGLARTARIPAEMLLPRLAGRTLRERFATLTEEGGGPKSGQGAAAYFHGCAANYFADGVGDAIIRLLIRRGVPVVLPRQHCSGTPIETYGHVEIARAHARYNLDSLLRYDTVITGCASCHLMLKDYPKFFEGADRLRAETLARRVSHISQFVLRHPGPTLPAVPGDGQPVTYHASCHLRVAGIEQEPRTILSRLPGRRYVEMAAADRCAGGAGTFLVKNAALSEEIFQRKRRAIAECGARTVATSCPACMIQLRNGLRDRVRVAHIAQLLDEAEAS